MRRLHIVLHVSHEGPGTIAEVAEEMGWELSFTRLFLGEPWPSMGDFDALVIMGGPMGVYDKLPSLQEEQVFLSKVLEADLPVLGVCLGAQLLAAAFGGKVYPHIHREIGWWPISPAQSDKTALFEMLGQQIVLHWHGDTFDLPAEAILLASSEACRQQAFSMRGGRILGLQFHAEVNSDMVKDFVEFDEETIKNGGLWVQRSEDILAAAATHTPSCRQLMHSLVRNWMSCFQ
jgi:GMP synthase-like glutamine amidotransferase